MHAIVSIFNGPFPYDTNNIFKIKNIKKNQQHYVVSYYTHPCFWIYSLYCGENKEAVALR